MQTDATKLITTASIAGGKKKTTLFFLDTHLEFLVRLSLDEEIMAAQCKWETDGQTDCSLCIFTLQSY